MGRTGTRNRSPLWPKGAIASGGVGTLAGLGMKGVKIKRAQRGERWKSLF